MGIEYFMGLLKKSAYFNTKYAPSISNIKTHLHLEELYFDFCAFIHGGVAKVDADLNKLLEKIVLVKELNGNERYYLENDSKAIWLEYQDIMQHYGIESIEELVEKKPNIQDWDELYITKLIEELVHFIERNCHRNVLRKLYVVFDGIPNHSKIHEQIRRRQMTYFVEGMKEKIFHTESDSMTEARKEFEKIRFRFNKIKINVATHFMDKLIDQLQKELATKLDKNFKELKTVQIIDYEQIGEGEIKIYNMLANAAINAKVGIYSPDSDMVILGMMLVSRNMRFHNTQPQIFILRHSFSRKPAEKVDINNILGNLIARTKNLKVPALDLIHDLVFILSVYGNDFIPKLPLMNPLTTFEALMICYAKSIREAQINITFQKDNNIRLNLKSALCFFKNLANFFRPPLGDELLLQKIHHSEINETLQEYAEFRQHILQSLKKPKVAPGKGVDLTENLLENPRAPGDNYQKNTSADATLELASIETNASETILPETIVAETVSVPTVFPEMNPAAHANTESKPDDEKDFGAMWEYNDKLLVIHDVLDYGEYNEQKIPDIENMITLHQLYWEKHKKFPIGFLAKSFYQTGPQKSFNQGRTPFRTSYDMKVYQLENILDGYNGIFDTTFPNLGRKRLDWEKLSLYQEPGNLSMKYYENYFPNQKVSPATVSKICDAYLEGLLWNFNYYLNYKPKMMYGAWHYEPSLPPLTHDFAYYLTNCSPQYIINKMKKAPYGIGFKKPIELYCLVSHLFETPELVTHKYGDKAKKYAEDIKKDNKQVSKNLDTFIESLWDKEKKPKQMISLAGYNMLHRSSFFHPDMNQKMSTIPF